MNIRRKCFRLYAVTDSRWAADEERFFQQIAAVIDGGAGVVQLREKYLDNDAFRRLAARFTALCREKGAVSVLNDRAEIAAETGADGVHLGQGDMNIRHARELLGPERLIGASAHTVEEALRAVEAGADYLGVGAAFATGTKADAKPIARETIRAITSAVSVPVVAIGGVTEENLPTLSGLGLDGVAVVSALFAQTNPGAAARRLYALSQQL